ncbi:MAG: PIN domain-containing protein [Betaproteobacteria bacterium]|nr:PIN domain-containing protein [Betaproteobacteria bacterium]
MKSTSVVDTNAIIRYLLADDPAHFARARAFFEQVREGGQQAYLPESVLAESVYVLAKVYGVERVEIADKLSALLDYRGISQENRALLRAALLLFRNRKVDFVDALAVATARERGWRVFSFDKDLERLAR